jgi:uncharacterized RDD family membrane protein YckC
MSTDESNGIRTIAGLWRRIGAFFLDSVVLGVIGLAAGYFLAEEFVQLGSWGRLLGFSVALIYFGILNSRLSGGQTLGKRLLKIKVVAKDGTPLSVSKSFLRFLPLGIPWSLNGAQFSESALSSVWLFVASVAVFGLGLSVIYLFVFNRNSRQSVDDLLVGSYVVSASGTGPVASTAPWPVHIAVCALLVVASGVLPYFTQNLAAREPFASIMNVYRAVSAEPWIVHVEVSKGKLTTSTNRGRSTSSYLNITAYSKDADVKNVERAKRLAILALSADHSASSLDVVRVTLVHGYDIGIASSWRSETNAHSPSEWLAQKPAIQ